MTIHDDHPETYDCTDESVCGRTLLGDDNASKLHARWLEIQGDFVDDPGACVQRADTLVAEVVDQLTSRFADARTQLESQWSTGDERSTEDLRMTLRRYRELFDRLLAV